MNRRKEKKKLLCLLLVYMVFLLSVLNGNKAEAAEIWAVPEAVGYDVTLYSVGNGIPTGEANAVLQTSDGYVWVGGYGGLLRYDGREYEQYSGSQTGLTSYSIRSLWESPEGVLWVGSNEQGAFYWKNGSFCRVKSSDEMSMQSVRCFAQGDDGQVWIGTSDGLAWIENGVVQPFDMEEYGYGNSMVYTLSADEKGLLWGVDYAGALFCVDSRVHTLKYYLAPGQLWEENLYAYSACVLPGGQICVGTSRDEILILENAGEDGARVTALQTGEMSAVNSLCVAEDGRVWCCGDTGLGIADVDSGTFSDLSGLEYTEHLLCIREDYEHNFWAASSKYGLLHITQRKVGALSAAIGGADTIIYAVAKVRDLFYVASDAGVMVLDEHWNVIQNAATKALEGIPVRHVAVDQKGHVYCSAYYGGLYVYDPETDTVSSVSVSGNQVRMALPLSNGTVAVAYNGGVDILKEETVVESYQSDLPVKSFQILCLEELSDGTLLCGSDGYGMYALKDGVFSLYANHLDGLSGNVILRIKEDELTPGKVWVSCGNDLFYGDGNGFKASAKLPVGSGSVLDIFQDGDNIWIFRSSCILQVLRSSLLKTGETAQCSVSFENAQGLPGTVESNSWSLFEDGKFLICTTEGLGYLDTENVYQNEMTPRLVIEAVSSSDGNIWDGGTLHLSKDAQKVSVSIAVLSYLKEEAVIEYWLEGFDQNPALGSVSALHDISYTNIPAGSYRLHIKAYNGDGRCSDEIVLPIVKQPRFTETVWFPVMVAASAVLITALILFLVGRVRIRRIRERQQIYKSITDQSIATIAGAIDAKDPYTNGHSRRVAEATVKIAECLGMSEEECERLYYIALMHDIGKIGIPDEILKKTGRLTEEEYEIIKKHPAIGGDILANFTALEGVADGARYHHERVDGKGYCKGLKGKEIPLNARIIAVADAYDAMNSDRCYRSRLSKEKILNELEEGKGRQFDPEIAEIAMKLIAEGKI